MINSSYTVWKRPKADNYTINKNSAFKDENRCYKISRNLIGSSAYLRAFYFRWWCNNKRKSYLPGCLYSTDGKDLRNST
jgi:hypothetical protein